MNDAAEAARSAVVRISTAPASLVGPVGRLEAVVDSPRDGPVGALAVICHPHPLHEGTLHNKVAHTLSRTFARLGAASVRFNFRGVGESAGAYANGEGETDDALAVVDWARRQWPGLPLYLAGFSFGGMVAVRAAAQSVPAGLVTVAPAVHRFDFEFRHPGCDWVVIQGTDDDVVPAADVRNWCAEIDPPPELRLIERTGHFFHGRLDVIGDAVRDFFGDRLGRTPG